MMIEADPAKAGPQSAMAAASRRAAPGIRRGSAAKSASGRTSIRTGPLGEPSRRTSLSGEMVVKADMRRPRLKERDAILRHVASWGDRSLHTVSHVSTISGQQIAVTNGFVDVLEGEHLPFLGAGFTIDRPHG
jgi:hypothetical protein